MERVVSSAVKDHLISKAELDKVMQNKPTTNTQTDIAIYEAELSYYREMEMFHRGFSLAWKHAIECFKAEDSLDQKYNMEKT